MRSVYTRVLASTAGVIALTLVAFLVAVRINLIWSFERGAAFSGLIDVQVAQAQAAYEAGGAPGLSAQLAELARMYPGTKRDVVDPSGRDLVTGENRSHLLGYASSKLSRINLFTPIYVVKRSFDGQYVLLFTPALDAFRTLWIYYFLVLMAIGLLCATLAFQFVSPLNKLTETVRKFGAGDLKARVNLNRRDELGDLATTFDQMAEHIEALLVAERRLLQDISHELRSPLARLSFAAELARTSPDREEAASRVRKEINRLDNLIERLLQVTSAQGDPDALLPQPVALEQIVEEVVDNCEIEASARECELVISTSMKPIVLGDSELLRRAFENVIRNAIKHSPPASKIEISISGSTDRAVVIVRDCGPGVPSEFLKSIFKPFFRVDRSRDASTGGTGLGLAIVQRTITMHHGKVWAENANPGLKIIIELPADGSIRKAAGETSRLISTTIASEAN